jgi:histidinol phosphatase-like enzyme (inositol monophosphatase family)
MYQSELKTALDCAQKAGQLQLKFQSNISSIEIKEDQSPVTEIDKMCEQLIRDQLLTQFSTDGFLGEETGVHTGVSGKRWIVDPLDGTRPYIRGIPTHSVLIALEENDVPVIGVIHLPAMGITCWAQKGNGAFLNGQKIHVSDSTTLKKSIGSALGFLEHAEKPEGKQLFTLMRDWDYAYGFMDAYSYVCVASGKLDLAVNLLDKPWDCAAAACIVNEAGGSYSDISGNRTVHNGSIVLSNGGLHETILDYFR